MTGSLQLRKDVDMKVAVAILAIWEYLGLAKKWINLYRITIGIHRITISQTSVLKPPDFSLTRPVMPYQMSLRVRDFHRCGGSLCDRSLDPCSKRFNDAEKMCWDNARAWMGWSLEDLEDLEVAPCL